MPGAEVLRFRKRGFDHRPPSDFLGDLDAVWPGMKMDLKAGVDAVSGPTGAPWLDSNGWYVRLARSLVNPRTLWLAFEPSDLGQALPATAYLQAIADTEAYGARWMVSLDPHLRVGLLDRRAAALDTWATIGRSLAFFRTHRAWAGYVPAGQLGVVSDYKGTNEFLSFEVLNLLARQGSLYHVLEKDSALQAPFDGLDAVVYVDEAPPAADLVRKLYAFAESGGTLVTPSGWEERGVHDADAWPSRYRVFRYGRGRLAVAREDGPGPPGPRRGRPAADEPPHRPGAGLQRRRRPLPPRHERGRPLRRAAHVPLPDALPATADDRVVPPALGPGPGLDGGQGGGGAGRENRRRARRRVPPAAGAGVLRPGGLGMTGAGRRVPSELSRRKFLAGSTTAALGLGVGRLVPFAKAAPAATVSVAKCDTYGAELVPTLDRMFDQIGGLGRLVKGKTVAVKLNMTGPATIRLGPRPGRARPLGPPPDDRRRRAPHGPGGRPTDPAARGRLRDRRSPSRSTCTRRAGTRRRWPGPAGAWSSRTPTGSAAASDYPRFDVPGGGLLFPSYVLNHSYRDCDVFVSLTKLKDHTHGRRDPER